MLRQIFIARRWVFADIFGGLRAKGVNLVAGNSSRRVPNLFPGKALVGRRCGQRIDRRQFFESMGEISRFWGLREVVLVLRPLCSPFKVDHGFISGCHSH
ncbi:hypothetical protein, partial [Pseudorhodobacter antarcticus]|uniref:hypothetical protein n=1 Tax=Pseudorhodobacter antarcticus TaxID=1077947 RepID=UPI001C314B58